jgi:hypothetical protein
MSTTHLLLSSVLQPEGNQKVIQIEKNTDLNSVFEKSQTPNALTRLLAVEHTLKELIKCSLIAPEPLLVQGDYQIFYPNSIMVIQGQSGVHKSRVAENICASFIMNSIQTSHLGFLRNQEEPIDVLYADTERNLSYQLPAAIQKICNLAGFYIQSGQSMPDNFHFTSLIEIERQDRFQALEAFIRHKRNQIPGHLVVVLDVITDCVVDFNRPDGSLQLIDMMNRMINQSNCSFLCVIHENPGSDKARGHLGTEIMNKASTVLQVGFVKQNGQTTDVVEMKFLKTRNTKKPESMFAQYSEEFHTLVLLDDDSLVDIKQSLSKQSAIEETVENLEIVFQDKSCYTNKEITDRLMEMLHAKPDAIRKRLGDVINKKWPLKIGSNQYLLTKSPGKKYVEYAIVPMVAEIAE